METLSIKDVATIIGLFFGFCGWIITRNAQTYARFDDLYQQVLKMGVEDPSLIIRKSSQELEGLDAKERAKYDAYAYMVFNVCETVADELGLYKDRSRPIVDGIEWVLLHILPITVGRKWMDRTWRPILVAEMQLHGPWLRQQKANVRFKQEFLELMGSVEKNGAAS